MKPVLIVLGVGIIIVGLAGMRVTPWLGWLDIALGIVSFFIAAGVPQEVGRSSMIGPVGLGVAALVLWVIGLAVGASTPLTWWTFAFGIAYFLSAGMALPVGPGKGPRV